jgi:hypothetical protein
VVFKVVVDRVAVVDDIVMEVYPCENHTGNIVIHIQEVVIGGEDLVRFSSHKIM